MEGILQKLDSLTRNELYLIQNRIVSILLNSGKDDKRMLVNIIKTVLIEITGNTKTGSYSTTSDKLEEALQAIEKQVVCMRKDLSRKEYVVLIHILVEESIRHLKESNRQITISAIVATLSKADHLMNIAFPGYSGQALLFAVKHRVANQRGK